VAWEGRAASSDRDDRVDVLDLLINLLKEHEAKLDDLSRRLEEIMEQTTPRAAPSERLVTEVSLRAHIMSWTEFRRLSRGAIRVALSTEEGQFKVMSIKGGILHDYQEKVPYLDIIKRVEEGMSRVSFELDDVSLLVNSLRGRLDCGLALQRREKELAQLEDATLTRLEYWVDSEHARRWLAQELEVEDSRIILGELHLR
jgi:hypothetical protein